MAELCQRHSTLKHFWLVFLLNRDSAFRYFTLKRCRFVIFFDVLGVYSRSLRRVFTAVEPGKKINRCYIGLSVTMRKSYHIISLHRTVLQHQCMSRRLWMSSINARRYRLKKCVLNLNSKQILKAAYLIPVPTKLRWKSIHISKGLTWKSNGWM